MTLVINDVEEIPSDAYKENFKIENLVIESGVKKIGYNAFSDCKNLKNIILPDGIEIDSCAFKNCISLQHIEIPDNAKLDSSVFRGCTALKEIIISDSTTFLYGSPFENCSAITEITYPDSIENLKGFGGCTNLEKINYPALCKSVSGFSVNKKITRLEFPRSIIKISGFDKFYDLEEIVFNEDVTEISGFNDCPKIKKVVFPRSLVQLDGYSFSDCAMLEEVEFLNPNTKNECRFSGSPYGKKLLKEKMKKYISAWQNPYTGNSKIKKIIVRDGVTEISGFDNMANLEEIDFPPSVIKVSGFNGCPKIKCVEFNLGCLNINGFEKCATLEQVEFPLGVQTVAGFNECVNLKSVELKEGIESVEAFGLCENLESISIADTVQKISAIKGCPKLAKGNVALPESFCKEFVFPDAAFGIKNCKESFDFESLKEKYNPFASAEENESGEVSRGYYFAFSKNPVHLPKNFFAEKDSLFEPISITQSLAKKFAESLGCELIMEEKIGSFKLRK